MSEERKFNFKPSLLKALKLKCPYCGETSLVEKGNPFKFGKGCEACDYNFERDESYYSGANQLISFPVAGTTGLILAAVLYGYFEVSIYMSAGFSFFTMVFFIFGFWPFSLAIWLWMDHSFKPLSTNEKYTK